MRLGDSEIVAHILKEVKKGDTARLLGAQGGKKKETALDLAIEDGNISVIDQFIASQHWKTAFRTCRTIRAGLLNEVCTPLR